MRVRVLLKTGMTREVPIGHYTDWGNKVEIYQPGRGVHKEFVPWYEIRAVQFRYEEGDEQPEGPRVVDDSLASQQGVEL